MLGAYFTVVYSFGLTRINQFCWIQRTRFCQPQLEKAAKLATRGPVTKASVTSTQPASMDGTRKGGNQIPTVYLLEPSISRISPPYLKSKTPQNPHGSRYPYPSYHCPDSPATNGNPKPSSSAGSCAWVGPSAHPASGSGMTTESRTRIGDPKRRGRARGRKRRERAYLVRPRRMGLRLPPMGGWVRGDQAEARRRSGRRGEGDE